LTSGIQPLQESQLAIPKLLIMDEFDYLPFELAAAHLLFQLVRDRYS
jgi:DNA replication protein DnaC